MKLWRVGATDTLGNDSAYNVSWFKVASRAPVYDFIITLGADTNLVNTTQPMRSGFKGALVPGSSPEERSFTISNANALRFRCQRADLRVGRTGDRCRGQSDHGRSTIYIKPEEDTFAPPPTQSCFHLPRLKSQPPHPLVLHGSQPQILTGSTELEVQRRQGTSFSNYTYQTVFTKSGLAENTPPLLYDRR